MKENQCPTFIGGFLGHKFRPRYEEKPKADELSFAKLECTSVKMMKAATTLNIYVRDVCERCGAVIERSKT